MRVCQRIQRANTYFFCIFFAFCPYLFAYARRCHIRPFHIKCKHEFSSRNRLKWSSRSSAQAQTTVLYCLGHRLSSMGRRVLLTTTTRIYRPDDILLYLGSRERLRPGSADGSRLGMADARKLAGYSAGDIGAPRRELCSTIYSWKRTAQPAGHQSPNDTEPVYPQPVDIIIGVIGLDAPGSLRRRKPYTACRCLRACQALRRVSLLPQSTCSR